MAEAVDFPGANTTFLGGDRGDVSDLRCFANGKAIVSAWKLTPEEIEEVRRTGTVFVSSLSGKVLFPIFIGSETSVRRVVADYGDVWQRPDPDGPRCFVPDCARRGEIFPVVGFDAIGARWDPHTPVPYRLEIPRLLCEDHAETFDPQVFFSPAAREHMSAMIVAAGKPEPDFSRLDTEWRPHTDPAYAELRDGGEARLWF